MQGTFKESSWIFYMQKAKVIHSSTIYLRLKSFLHFSCLWQSLIGHGNDIHGQFVILYELFLCSSESGNN